MWEGGPLSFQRNDVENGEGVCARAGHPPVSCGATGRREQLKVNENPHRQKTTFPRRILAIFLFLLKYKN